MPAGPPPATTHRVYFLPMGATGPPLRIWRFSSRTDPAAARSRKSNFSLGSWERSLKGYTRGPAHTKIAAHGRPSNCACRLQVVMQRTQSAVELHRLCYCTALELFVTREVGNEHPCGIA